MVSELPLARRTIVVTRPDRQSAELVRMIAARGGTGIAVPLVDIQPLPERMWRQNMARNLSAYDIALFISPNAVEATLPHLLAENEWPCAVTVVVPGPGTAASLHAYGVSRVRMPDGQHDSESMLAMPELQAECVRGRPLVLFCGENGRPCLREALLARGAQLDVVATYRRVRGADVLAQMQRVEPLDAIVVTSSGNLRLLHALSQQKDGQFLNTIPLFVPHARIAETAQTLGLRHIISTATGNTGIVAGLCAYNWPSS